MLADNGDKISTIPSEQKKTIKQRKWLKLYLECGNASEAAFKVYNCKNRESAANIGWENVRKLDFSNLMEESGLTDAYLNKKLDEGLGATKQIGARKIVQGARVGHEIKVDSTTDTDDFIEVADYAIRHKYLETALKLKKRLTDKVDITTDGEKITGIDVTIIEVKQGPENE